MNYWLRQQTVRISANTGNKERPHWFDGRLSFPVRPRVITLSRSVLRRHYQHLPTGHVPGGAQKCPELWR